MPDLTEAAERVRKDLAGEPLLVIYPDCGSDVQAMLRLHADRDLLGDTYAAEMDSTPVDEEWLRENCKRESHVWGIHGTAFFIYHHKTGVHADKFRVFFSDSECQEVDMNIEATRGLVRTLMRIGGGM